MIFAKILEIVAMTDLASVLRARKFSFIIIFKSFEIGRRRFYVFFKFGRRRETSALRAC